MSLPGRTGAISGALSILLGFIVLVGWAVHSTFLTQVAADLPPVERDTAINFVLSGLVLIGIVKGRPRFTFTGSAVIAALAAVGLLGYRTSPVSALCFIVLAAGFVLSQVVPLPKRSAVLGGAGILVASIAAACGIGVMWGGGGAFGWGDWARMAVLTCAGFLLLGHGAVAVALGMIQAVRRPPLWAPIGAVMFVVTIRIGLLQAFSPKNQADVPSALTLLGALAGPVLFGVFVYIALQAHLQRELLGTVNRRLEDEVLERVRAEEATKAANERLEQRVEERTRELEAANEDLRRQKEILETMIHHVPLILKFVDKDGRIQMLNREWERVLGRTLDEIENQGVDVYEEGYPDPADRQSILDFVATSNGEWADFKTRLKDGRVIDTSWAVVRLSDGATICIGQDISERKQAERELLQQKELLQTIFDHIPLIVGFVDQEKRIKLVNREWERTLGWSFDEIRGERVETVIAEHSPDPENAGRVRDFVRDSDAEWADFKMKVRDGRVIETSWSVLHLSDGTSIGIGQDISERKRAEEELRKQKEILQTIFDHIPVMVGFVDRNGRFQLVNREWERTLGYSLEELHSQDIDILEKHYPDPVHREQARAFVRDSEAEWVDFKTKLRDGRAIDVSWAVLHLSDGTSIGIGQDITDRKQADQDLRKQKEILQTIFDHIPLMVGFVDQNGVAQMVNRAWEHTLGWTLDEIKSQHIDLIQENYPDPEYRRKVRDFVTNSDAEWADFKTTVRDGRVIDTSWTMLRLSDGTGIGIGQDITKRKRAEEALRESEERFRQLAENIHDLFWIKTADFKRVLYLSPVYESMSGRSAEDRYRDDDYQSFLNTIVPEDRERMAELMRRGAREEFDVEFRIRRPDGSIHWIHDRGFPIRDQSGQIYRVAGIANDITERKLAEEALRDSEERFRQLAENINEVFWITSADFSQQVYISPGFQNLTGEPPETLYPGAGHKPFFAFVHPDDLPLLRDLTKNPEGFDAEYRMLRADGSIRWVRDRGFPIRNRRGEIYRFGGVADDITDQKEAEDRLKASSEQLRALSASLQSAREMEATRIAHQVHDELGGILTGLRWELEALEKMIPLPADACRSKAMQDKLSTMVALTDTTINVVRRIASELRPSILDDLGLVEAIEWQTQQFQGRTGIVCRCDCSMQSIALSDQQSTALFRIVQEALTNILRHAQATHVAVGLNEECGELVLTVTDNGRGITEAEKLSRNSLGLLGMQERAHLIGGRVEIVGREGTGTTLNVRVPVAKAQLAGSM